MAFRVGPALTTPTVSSATHSDWSTQDTLNVTAKCDPNPDIVGTGVVLSFIIPAVVCISLQPIGLLLKSAFLDLLESGLRFSQLLTGVALFISSFTLPPLDTWNFVVVNAFVLIALWSRMALVLKRRNGPGSSAKEINMGCVLLIVMTNFIPTCVIFDTYKPIVAGFLPGFFSWFPLLAVNTHSLHGVRRVPSPLNDWLLWLMSAGNTLVWIALVLHMKFGQTICPMNTPKESRWNFAQILPFVMAAGPLLLKLEARNRRLICCSLLPDEEIS